MIKVKTKLKDYTQKIEQKLNVAKVVLNLANAEYEQTSTAYDSVIKQYDRAVESLLTPELISSIKDSIKTQLQYKAIESSPIKQYLYNLIGVKYINNKDHVPVGTRYDTCRLDINDVNASYVESMLDNRTGINSTDRLQAILSQFDVDHAELRSIALQFAEVNDANNRAWDKKIKIVDETNRLETILSKLKQHSEFFDYDVEIDLDTGDVCKC